MSARFAGRSVLVTGAASGIGQATAQLFADEGARVLAVDVADGVDETAAGRAAITAYRADTGSEADVAAMIAAAVERHGGLDILCANAGVSGGMAGLLSRPPPTGKRCCASTWLAPSSPSSTARALGETTF